MRLQPDLEAARAYARAGEYRTLPVSTELLSDVRTPMEVLRALKYVSSHCYLLESVAGDEQWGHYTFLGYDPSLEIRCLNGEMHIGSVVLETNEPSRYIRQILAQYHSQLLANLPPFTGGLVGYFSYDYLKYAEPTLRLDAADSECFQDVDLMLFDKVICFDHYRQKIILMVNIDLNNVETEYNRAAMVLEEMKRLVTSGTPRREKPGRLLGEVRPLFSKQEFCDMVEKARRHIYEGDIFQIVLSNRLEAPYEGSLLNAYRVLRTKNPSPYMFYLSGTDVEVAGASPETLEKDEFAPLCRRFGVELISLIAPTSENRIAMIAREAEGFLYIVSSLGVTGVRSEITTDLGAMVRLVRQVTDVPCAIGFGISTPAQAQAMAALSDGAIVGSAIVKLIAEHGEAAAPYAGAYVKAMKDAVARA